MTDLSVVHLVWHRLGIEPFRRFVDSYRRHEAGIEHDLVLVFKEFSDEKLHEPYYDLMAGLRFQALVMPGSWFDIPAYFALGDHLHAACLGFLNSNSEIQADHWLAKLHGHLLEPGVGLVGATGSWESHLDSARGQSPAVSLQPWVEAFDPFPNAHVRTNAFMLRRELMAGLPWRPRNDKWDCWKFESGKQGLTRQVLSRGLRPLVVGRDGAAHEAEHWPASRTFRAGGQENLLVADNQTRDYAQADAQRRQTLAGMAWGSGGPQA
jgi:hypothetical protein